MRRLLLGGLTRRMLPLVRGSSFERPTHKLHVSASILPLVSTIATMSGYEGNSSSSSPQASTLS